MKIKAGSLKRATKLINFNQTHQGKKRRGLKSMKLETKKEKLQLTQQNTKNHKRLP